MNTIVTESGARVPELKINPGLFLNKTTVLYGPSKTGKTVMVKNIMKQLNGHIEQILLISPTEPSNNAFEGFIDPSLIHYDMKLPDKSIKKDTPLKSAVRFLDNIYKRQEMAASIYSKVNKSSILSLLYNRLTDKEKKSSDKYIASLERKRRRVIDNITRQYVEDLGLCDKKVQEVNEKFEKMLNLVYKKFISPNVKRLWKLKDLSEDESYTLYYLHFNPRLLLIFDDCASKIKSLQKEDVMRKLFYQNRHVFISNIICCQDDTDLPANLRKNVFMSIFTTPIVCTANFNRTSNNFSKHTRSYVSDIISDVFEGYRKLAYIRDDEKQQHFYHISCPYPRPFLFGSPALKELCSSVSSSNMIMDDTNPFYDKFRVEKY